MDKFIDWYAFARIYVHLNLILIECIFSEYNGCPNLYYLFIYY